MRTIFISILLLSMHSQAETNAQALKALALPKAIVELQNSTAGQGECEASWPQLARSNGVIQSIVGDGMVLYLIPCANWSEKNLAWSAYLTIRVPSRPDGFLTKAIRFVDYSSYAGIVAQDYAYNIVWNEKTQVMKTQYFQNGSPLCGSQAALKWDSDQRQFRLLDLIKREDCSPTNTPWESVLKKTQPIPQGQPGAPSPVPHHTAPARENINGVTRT